MSEIEAIVFKNCRNQNLVGILHHGKGEEPRPCIITCHGFVETKIGDRSCFLVNFARYAVEHNLSVFRFDFAGCGDSDGDFIERTLDSDLEDLQAAIDVVSQASSVELNKIGLFGQCLGSVTAVRASFKDPRVYKVAIWAPLIHLPSSLQNLVGKEAFQILELGEEVDFIYRGQYFQCGYKILSESSHINIFQKMNQIEKPLLVMHGTEDPIVPLSEINNMMDFAQETPGEKKLTVIEGAIHAFPFHQEGLFNLIINWFL